MKILIATRNRHKVDEIQSILGPGWTCLTLEQFPDAPAIEESAPDFAGNATLKAVGLAEWLARRGGGIDYVLADDSGLEVDALNGAPGVHSARFAAIDTAIKGNSSDSENNAKLLRLLADIPPAKRTARFKCVIAFTPVPCTDPVSNVCSASEAELGTELFEGACEGTLLNAPRGGSGFGYDPLFVPDGFDQTFAELGEETKNRISHRSRALERFLARRRGTNP